MTTLLSFQMFALLCTAACDSQPIAAVAGGETRTETAKPARAPVASPAAATEKLTLAGRPSTDSNADVARAAARRQMTDVEITSHQSFRVLEDGREVATLTTGEGNLPGPNAGCFVAIRAGGQVALAPTIGTGMFEAVACNEATAVGILSSGDIVTIGVLFAASSPNAEVTEPVMLAWDRAAGTLAVDEPRSKRASEAGEQSIAAMRRAAR